MTIPELGKLEYGAKIVDTMTGEEFTYGRFKAPYAICFDKKGVTVWLLPYRIEVKE